VQQHRGGLRPASASRPRETFSHLRSSTEHPLPRGLVRVATITGPSSLLRVGPPQCSASVLSPRGFGRLSFSLNIGATGSRSSVQPPASASRPLYAGRHPLSFIRHPAGSSQASYTHLVLTTLDFLTTRLRKVHFRSSLGCTPARVFLALFLQRSPPRLLTAAAWRWFEICS
jgi:hypothetical protein